MNTKDAVMLCYVWKNIKKKLLITKKTINTNKIKQQLKSKWKYKNIIHLKYILKMHYNLSDSITTQKHQF